MQNSEPPLAETRNRDRPSGEHGGETLSIRRLAALCGERFALFWPHGDLLAVGAAAFSKERRGRSAAISLAIVLNALFVLAAMRGLIPRTHNPDEIHLVLAPSVHNETALPPSVPEPTIPVIEMPDIVIQSDTPSTAPSAADASDVLAPRPDPTHPNPSPTASEIAATGLAGALIVLKILVLPDGTVTDASVVRSCGRSDADLTAIAYVKTNWKFLPAVLGVTAIPYWTTVSVRLS